MRFLPGGYCVYVPMATMSSVLVGIRPDRRDTYDEAVLVMHAPVWGKPRRITLHHDEEAFVLETVVKARTQTHPGVRSSPPSKRGVADLDRAPHTCRPSAH